MALLLSRQLLFGRWLDQRIQPGPCCQWVWCHPYKLNVRGWDSWKMCCARRASRERRVSNKSQMSGLSRWCKIVTYCMCFRCLYLCERNFCFPLKLLMHIHADLGSTCARRDSGPQWTAVSLSCSSNRVSHPPPIKDWAPRRRLRRLHCLHRGMTS